MEIASLVFSIIGAAVGVASLVVTIYCWKHIYNETQSILKKLTSFKIKEEGDCAQIFTLAKRMFELNPEFSGIPLRKDDDFTIIIFNAALNNFKNQNNKNNQEVK